MYIHDDGPFERSERSRSNNMATIASVLDPLYESYEDKIQEFADRVWATTIKPYLDASGISYRECNGQWWFEIDDRCYYPVGYHGQDISDDLLEPDDQKGWLVFDLLETIVPGTNACLCIYMPSKYDPA